MKKCSSILIVGIMSIMVLYQEVSAQLKMEKTNSAYLEIGGNNFYYSINYEKKIFANFSPRIGFSIIPWGESSHTYGTHLFVKISLLTMLNYSLNLSSEHSLEFGLGYAELLDNERMYQTYSFGFRYTPNNGKMFYQLSFTPIMNEKIVKNRMWGGISIGILY